MMRGTQDAKLVGRHLAKDEGEGIWFIGSFMRFKAHRRFDGWCIHTDR